MSGLSVAECLLEADRQVRDLTFDAGSLDGEALAAAWPVFSQAAAVVLESLLGPVGGGLESLVALQASRVPAYPPTRVEGRLVHGAGLLRHAASLIRVYAAAAGAVDRNPVAAHVMSTLCVAAHVVAWGVRDAPGGPAPVIPPAAGARASRHAPRGAPADAARAAILAHAERIEDLTRITVTHAGHRTAAAPDPQGDARIEPALDAWLQLLQRDLQTGTLGVGDLRLAAKINADIESHTAAIARAAGHYGSLTPAQLEGLTAPLTQANRAWNAAAADWPAALWSPNAPGAGGLARAAAEVNQSLAAITHPGRQWASAAEVARCADPAVLLERLAHAHSQLALVARDYQDAARLLIRNGQVAVPGAAAFPYTRRAEPTARWVTVPPDHSARMSVSGEKLARAADSVRGSLETATAMSEPAVRRRARLPLSMTAAELDQAIRRRVDKAQSAPPGTRQSTPLPPVLSPRPRR